MELTLISAPFYAKSVTSDITSLTVTMTDDYRLVFIVSISLQKFLTHAKIKHMEL